MPTASYQRVVQKILLAFVGATNVIFFHIFSSNVPSHSKLPIASQSGFSWQNIAIFCDCSIFSIILSFIFFNFLSVNFVVLVIILQILIFQ